MASNFGFIPTFAFTLRKRFFDHIEFNTSLIFFGLNAQEQAVL